tara:strand:- start:82 stop:333 length:252 start_codon:yes stop_codon:yes gene_type:complete
LINRKVLKNLRKLPSWIQKKFALLIADLKDSGPEQPGWQNYSKLSDEKYHCHLGTSWVACWKHQKRTISVEVYYVGSREKAPY